MSVVSMCPSNLNGVCFRRPQARRRNGTHHCDRCLWPIQLSWKSKVMTSSLLLSQLKTLISHFAWTTIASSFIFLIIYWYTRDEGRVHDWMGCQCIAGPYMRICVWYLALGYLNHALKAYRHFSLLPEHLSWFFLHWGLNQVSSAVLNRLSYHHPRNCYCFFFGVFKGCSSYFYLSITFIGYSTTQKVWITFNALHNSPENIYGVLQLLVQRLLVPSQTYLGLKLALACIFCIQDTQCYGWSYVIAPPHRFWSGWFCSLHHCTCTLAWSRVKHSSAQPHGRQFVERSLCCSEKKLNNYSQCKESQESRNRPAQRCEVQPRSLVIRVRWNLIRWNL